MPDPPRLAVVGGGPRALWALERLLFHGASQPFSVDVFAGGGQLGVGSAYRTDQPDWLRLNVAASSVDVWSPARGGGPSFDEWRAERDPGSTEDAFPSRALTGRYLREQTLTVLDRLGPEHVTVRDEVVRELSPSTGGWLIAGSRYDQMLLVTGHEDEWTGALSRAHTPPPVAMHPRVFGVEELMARPEIRPGATVVIRGAALTALDAVLALTSVTEDIRIVLASRSGRLMHPKTEPTILARRLDLPTIHGLADTLVGEGRLPLPQALQRIADEILGADAGPPDELEAGPAVEEHRRALAVALGHRQPDAAWAWGQAWRAAYPALVRRQRSTSPLGPTLGWPEWQAWAHRMERLAFGPPPVNAAQLSALIDAGTVDVRAGDACAIAAELSADLLVDAVLAPPGIRHVTPDSLLGRLRDSGALTAAPHGRGALVDGWSRALDASGAPVPGLAIAGRATEDVVIGTDTLIRSLHPQIDGWARHVLAGESQP